MLPVESVSADRSVRQGTTLIELIVAIALMGVLLLSARQLLATVTDSSGRVRSQRQLHDASANGISRLQLLLRRADNTSPGASPLVGDGQRLQFDSWCDRAAGWLARCHIYIDVLQRSDSVVVLVRIPGEAAEEAWALPGNLAVQYLAADSWHSEWPGLAVPPDAILFAGARDSLLVSVAIR